MSLKKVRVLVRGVWGRILCLSLQKHQLTQQLAENAFSTLQPLHPLMPSDDSQLSHFFAGRPPQPEREGGREGDREAGKEGEGEGEREGEGGGEDEEELAGPPRAKKSRSQVRALDVLTLQVCFGVYRSMCLPVPLFVHLFPLLVHLFLCLLISVSIETQEAL